MNKKIHVIAHTHWDYEWYFTSKESFIQLCYHIDEVLEALETGIIDYYMLDGQMSIVEDYLHIHPENQERIKLLVQEGKLKIGPWYTQSDQMMIRGESLVRNLQIGIELGDRLGGADRLGYIPDAFGQSIDMPKIFSEMGINKAVFWRGLSSDQATQRELFWESEDGSRVVAYNIKDGYFVGVQLIEEDDSKKLINQITADTTSHHVALPVGGDQRYVDYNLKDRIAAYNTFEGSEFVESNYDFLFQQIQKEDTPLPSVQGEFLNAEVSKIHRSIYSSRYDHKYLNDKVERRLIYQLEPLLVMADRVGVPYKKSLVDSIWKTLLKSHAHDSAGGCNSDPTNRDILQRLKDADELSYSLVDYVTRKISESRKDACKNQITVFNTLPFSRKQIMHMKISTQEKRFSLYHQAKEIPFDIIQQNSYSNAPIRRENEPSSASFYYETEIVYEIEIPPLSYQVLKVDEQEKGLGVNQTSGSAEIENDCYSIAFSNGEIKVVDKASNLVYDHFIQLEDVGDDGDNYDYSPLPQEKNTTFNFSGSECFSKWGALKQTLFIKGKVNVPKTLKDRGSDGENTAIPYKLSLILYKNQRKIDVHLEMENTAYDHRMRLMINGHVETNQSIADTPFGTIARPVTDPNLSTWKKKAWKEEPTGIYPMLHFVNINDNAKSVTVHTKGIKEYEIVGSESKSIALTLFRAVGYLGKPDLLRRPGVASGNQFTYIETPDSQLQKKLTFKCSIVVGDTFSEPEAFHFHQKQLVSIPYYQHQSLNEFTNTLKYFVMQPLRYEVPSEYQFMDYYHISDVVFSSFHKSRQGNGYILRFFNPVSNSINDAGEFKLKNSSVRWMFVNMAENIEYGNMRNDSVIRLGHFHAKEIKTVYIEFKETLK